MEEVSRLRQNVLDLGIVESEIREVQATDYCGEIVFKFNHGVLQPISKINQTKKIK